MIRKVILLASLLMIALCSYSKDDANQLLKRAKAEANSFYDNEKDLRPKKKSDDAKYVAMEFGSGKQYVSRKSIALDLFEQAAEAGSGEAAYILFCYKWLGRYGKHKCFTPPWEKFSDSAVNECLSDLQRVADLHYPQALEFSNYINDISRNSNTDIHKDLIRIYEAISGDPRGEMRLGLKYKKSNPQRYEYWMKKSISHKDWPLYARTDYALYLLNLGRRDEALSVIKPAVKKTDYRNDQTADLGEYSLFFITDCIYQNDIIGAIKHCDYILDRYGSSIRHFYDEGVFDKFSEARDYNFLESCVNYFGAGQKQLILERIYEINKNPQDRTILFNRGNHYECYNDSITAFNYYKAAALKQHAEAFVKTFDYATKGYNLSNSETEDLLSILITSYDPETGDMSLAFHGWKVYYIFADFFYKSNDYRDFRKAVTLYNACVKNEYCPQILKGECARQLFKCFEFGRGVAADHEVAVKWLEYANRIGDSDANKISTLLYDLEKSH